MPSNQIQNVPVFISHQYRPNLMRRLSYYCQRVVVHRWLRASVVYLMGKWIGALASAPKASPHLTALSADGIARLGQVLSEQQCAEVLAYLADKPVYEKGKYLERAFSDKQPDDMTFGIHLLKDVLDCPHLMELVSSPDIVQLAASFLGCKPTLTCLGVQWSFPTKNPGIAQKFHRDSEGWKYLRFLVYLTDVDEGCGPHVYVEGSHKGSLPLRMKFYSTEELAQRYGSEHIVKVLGQRGTGLAADTSGIHKGELPTTRPRLVLNFTYAISPNVLTQYEPLRTRHSPQLKNYTNRLFLR